MYNINWLSKPTLEAHFYPNTRVITMSPNKKQKVAAITPTNITISSI